MELGDHGGAEARIRGGAGEGEVRQRLGSEERLKEGWDQRVLGTDVGDCGEGRGQIVEIYTVGIWTVGNVNISSAAGVFASLTP
jgi:hypothetical protein